MSRRWCLALAVAGGLSAFSCNPDTRDAQPLDIARRLLNEFDSEAARHGRIVNPSLIIFEMKDSVARAGRSYCGYTSTVNGKRLIEIDTTSNCWTGGKYAQEIIIYHELGHALLNRGHLNTKLPNGDWRTMMNTGSLLDLYHSSATRFKRSYYMDELFDEDTSIPDWAK